MGIYLPGSLYSIIFLLYSWGSLFGVPSTVPLSYSAAKVWQKSFALRPYGSFPKLGPQYRHPKYHSPYYSDPQKGTQILGNPYMSKLQKAYEP